MTRFRGLTWDHPRGYDSLALAAQRVPGLIQWDKQPLEGFESRPIETICAEYDVVVLDHPHLGNALAVGALRPLSSVYADALLAAIQARTIGPCFESYIMDGRSWALPLDAAVQVSAGRPDLMTHTLPRDWVAVERLAAAEPGFTLSLGGPHAFLSLLSMCATMNDQFHSVVDGLLQPHHDDAIELFGALVARSLPIGAQCNPIGILDAMAAGAGPTYCPLIFGYVPYGRGTTGAARVEFHDAPRQAAGGPPRAVLGGTGIAITQRCVPNDELLYHLAWLLSPEAQTGIIPENSGQPSAEMAWRSDSVNAASNGFYKRTIETLRHAFVRPRTAGFVSAQNRASQWLREHTDALSHSPAAIRAKLNDVLRGEGV